MEWQPIETAPLSTLQESMGDVLISDGSYVKQAWWDGAYWSDPFAPDGAPDFIDPQPTHWMPLPAPPTAG